MGFYSPDLQIKIIDYRINLMRHRDEVGNMHIINALLRDRRRLEAQL